MGLVKFASYVGVLAVLLGAFAPVLLSHVAGGWTRKFSSPGFNIAKIPSLDGKVALVTGGNTGIGFETAKELAKKGCKVYILSRDEKKGKHAVEVIGAVNNRAADSVPEFMPLDLASFDSIRSFAEAWKAVGKPIDMLILNAGVMKSPGEKFAGKTMTYGFDKTAEGFESHIGINYIGHFYLAQLLRPFLGKDSRMVVVSSAAEEGAPPEGIRFDLWKQETQHAEYEDGIAYGQSKFAGILFAKEAAKRWKEAGIQVYSCHPGIIKTDLGRYMQQEMTESAKGDAVATFMNTALMTWYDQAMFTRADGALTQLHLAVTPAAKLVNGAYYVPIGMLEAPKHPQATNEALQKELWDKTEEVIKSVTE